MYLSLDAGVLFGTQAVELEVTEARPGTPGRFCDCTFQLWVDKGSLLPVALGRPSYTCVM